MAGIRRKSADMLPKGPLSPQVFPKLFFTAIGKKLMPLSQKNILINSHENTSMNKEKKKLQKNYWSQYFRISKEYPPPKKKHTQLKH